MAIIIQCTCGSKYSVKDEHAGQSVRCPKCEAIIPVPAASAPPDVPVQQAADPPPTARQPAPQPAAQPMWSDAGVPAGAPAQSPVPPGRGDFRYDDDGMEMPRPLPVSKGAFLWVWIITVGLSVAGSGVARHMGSFGGGWPDRDIDEPSFSKWQLITHIPAVVGVISALVLLHKMWAALQPYRERFTRNVRTTPGKAVGFLFIPLYNYYWLFEAFWGWSKDYNALVIGRGYRLPRAHVGLALVLSIALLFSITAPEGGIGQWVHMIMFAMMVVFIASGCDVINALAGVCPGQSDAPPDLEGVASTGWNHAAIGLALAMIGYGYTWSIRSFLHVCTTMAREIRHMDAGSEMFKGMQQQLNIAVWSTALAVVCIVVGLVMSMRALKGPSNTLQAISRRQIALAGAVVAFVAMAEIVLVLFFTYICPDKTVFSLFEKTVM